MFKHVARKLVQAITRTRKFYYRRLREIAPTARGHCILEIGSGKQVKGQEAYSAVHIFTDVAEFRQTDMNPAHGHEVLDITSMTIRDRYDMILCLNVLEHVYETETAVRNLHTALRPGGRLIVAVPFAFPLHDEPHDYYRFTRFALERMLADFEKAEVEVHGPAKMPFGHFVIATKRAT
ncbi:methyltransferase domain-containing protein [uncultured Ruegeria sp.]|uniref:class I SAM-dependent methyltransferase n=1 Tax=uncultured Ruegeria sp. TaxID=259304 RepID=UPI00262A3598|nr:methyltransferase domain-containing protein [uncultured Ruegeria sp.]